MTKYIGIILDRFVDDVRCFPAVKNNGMEIERARWKYADDYVLYIQYINGKKECIESWSKIDEYITSCEVE